MWYTGVVLPSMRAVPLAGTHPALPQDDLAAFLKWLEGVRVLGLGEPTHGTREAFELKHRLIRLLAEQANLTTVAFECGFATARFIDRYVRFGEGDAHAALTAQGYWCWNTAEVLALVEWLRRHNAPLPPERRVRFVGVDVQGHEAAVDDLMRSLQNAEPQLLAACEETLQRLRSGQVARSETEAGKVVSQLRTLENASQNAEAQACARQLWRYAETYLNPQGFGRRDGYMAQTLLDTCREGLTVVWAHNEHVAVNADFFGGPALGWVLREALGPGYLALGMLFGAGEFQARAWRTPGRPIQAFTLPEAPTEHVEHTFADFPPSLLDLRDTNEVFAAAIPRRFLGTLYDPAVAAERPEEFRVVRPLRNFDMLAWLPRTTRAQPW